MPEFQITDRTTVSILGRLIDVVLKAAPRAEIMAVHSVARSQGIEVNVAAVDQGFSSEAHRPFDQKMKALFDIDFEQARNHAAFHKHLEPGLMSSMWARDILSIRSNP